MARRSIIVQISTPWKTYMDREYEFPIVKIQDKYSLIIYWYGEHSKYTSYREGRAFGVERKSKTIHFIALGAYGSSVMETSSGVKHNFSFFKKFLNKKLTKQLAMIALILCIMAGDYSAKM